MHAGNSPQLVGLDPLRIGVVVIVVRAKGVDVYAIDHLSSGNSENKGRRRIEQGLGSGGVGD